MMIVLGILGAILAFGVPRMNFKNGNVKSVMRELSVLTRQIRNQARVKNRTYRLVFEMEQKSSHYWIESADAGLVAPSKVTEEREKAAESGVDSDKLPPPKFQKDESILKKEKSLPPGFFIGSVETARNDEPVSNGKAYIYFTSEGLVERAAVQVTNRQQTTWTLIVNPLTGHADVMEKAVRLKDAVQE
jgi:general secretion pathway protein H